MIASTAAAAAAVIIGASLIGGQHSTQVRAGSAPAAVAINPAVPNAAAPKAAEQKAAAPKAAEQKGSASLTGTPAEQLLELSKRAAANPLPGSGPVLYQKSTFSGVSLKDRSTDKESSTDKEKGPALGYDVEPMAPSTSENWSGPNGAYALQTTTEPYHEVTVDVTSGCAYLDTPAAVKDAVGKLTAESVTKYFLGCATEVVNTKVHGALLEVLSEQSGLTVSDNVADSSGRKGVAVSMTYEQAADASNPQPLTMQSQFILDSATGRLLEATTTTLKDSTNADKVPYVNERNTYSDFTAVAKLGARP